MRRGVIFALVWLGLAWPAEAQYFGFFSDTSERRAAPRANLKNQPQVSRRPTQSSSFWGLWDDDDEDDRRSRRRDAQQKSKQALGPALLDGGPRPNISPAQPATVRFASGYATGSVVIDTNARALYYVLSDQTAYRYPIAVGREGFSWSGTEKVTRKAAWPDWRPPLEMRERDPRLPELMTGGLKNPLGAMAIYLGNSLYRIHGTNDARSIGTASSSGCFRMTNAHVTHLASLVGVGAAVHVLSRLPATVQRNIAEPAPAKPAPRRS